MRESNRCLSVLLVLIESFLKAEPHKEEIEDTDTGTQKITKQDGKVPSSDDKKDCFHKCTHDKRRECDIRSHILDCRIDILQILSP